ncbi:hypothetical protein SSP531S_24370 [Streptomyces spongiicola]|uniref:Uncharacterized protein n=1 Tax=Streptomyces spongiicola TaxID=1690221 RepID=A0A388SZ21_9ACTN|nr:hypothetical protein SSP531S_24370 [Streptomyces spongiicola]
MERHRLHRARRRPSSPSSSRSSSPSSRPALARSPSSSGGFALPAAVPFAVEEVAVEEVAPIEETAVVTVA